MVLTILLLLRFCSMKSKSRCQICCGEALLEESLKDIGRFELSELLAYHKKRNMPFNNFCQKKLLDKFHFALTRSRAEN